jgi:hypothetical protein
MTAANYHKVKTTVKETAQAFTTSWVDYGSEVDVEGYNSIAAWIKIDINDTNNPQIRVLAKLDKDGAEEYSIPIQAVGASDVKLEQQYYEFNVDEDASYLLEVLTKGHAKTIQFQIKCGTVGASAGEIEHIYVTLKND